VTEPAAHSGGPSLRRVRSAFALHDWILLLYHAVMLALCAAAPADRARGLAGLLLGGSALTLAAAAAFGRSARYGARRVRGAVYRVVLTSAVVGSYLMLRQVLPVVQSGTLDHELYRLDLVLFGVEPALFAQSFTAPAVVEYFAFFYFSYFGLLLVYTFALLGLGAGGTALTEFTIGTALVYTIGQLGYVVVPGFGPFVHLRDVFEAPLHGGVFWRAVQSTVTAGGAQRDIFPSLHTATPVWFTLFAARRARSVRAWTIPAIVTGFFAANIVASTMILRWHYAVDVVAGLALALVVALLAPRLARWEVARRERAGLAPVF
jgi:membrane-associated phospholipid phosphatase